MKLPPWPAPRPLEKITPTLYNAALPCPARAHWIAFGDRAAFPSGPAGILGAAFHGVAESAAKGQLPDAAHSRREAAAKMFEAKAQQAYDRAHPLVRWRYPAPQHMPYYALLQAESAENALFVNVVNNERAGGQSWGGPERKMTSRDGELEGRADLVDMAGQAVVDYKSGLASPSDEGVREHEARQLRLYAFLCAENGIAIKRGVIVRRDGSRNELLITPKEASDEAEAARALLREINARTAAGAPADDLAVPSADNCRVCVCRPVCEPFWRAAHESWAPEVAPCAEGMVCQVARQESSGHAVMRLSLIANCGVMPRGQIDTDALPVALSEIDGSPPLREGQTVRIVDAVTDPGASKLRARRNGLTTVWSCGT